MNNIRAIIIEDDRTQRELIENLINEVEEIVLLKSFDSAVHVSRFLENNEVDLILLDIEMPVMTGIEFLKKTKCDALVILITSSKEFAMEAYEFDVIDYMVKPISYARFLRMVTKAFTILSNKENSKSRCQEIFVKVNSLLERIALKDIMYIKAAGEYVHIIAKGRKYLVKTSMVKIFNQLPESDFVRAHRSYIVRIDKILMFDGNSFKIANKLIPISKTYRHGALEKINIV
ncbi:MAG: response regulator transcription factor [Flavobacteriales bacterium]|nr:response regulator transcription factor [Flavobacteriales bacterium]